MVAAEAPRRIRLRRGVATSQEGADEGNEGSGHFLNAKIQTLR